MKKTHLALLLIILGIWLNGITRENVDFLLSKEQHHLLSKYATGIENLINIQNPDTTDVKSVLNYAQSLGNLPLAQHCHYHLAMQTDSFEDALQWLRLSEYTDMDSLAFDEGLDALITRYDSPADNLIWDFYLVGLEEEEYLQRIKHLSSYNSVIEALAKSWIDEISVERSDSLALDMITRFDEFFLRSEWAHVSFYYKLYHLSTGKQYTAMRSEVESKARLSPTHEYTAALFAINPSFRKESGLPNSLILNLALQALNHAKDVSRNTRFLFDVYTPEHWQNRVRLTEAKVLYYQLLDQINLYGDEEDLTAILDNPSKQYKELLRLLDEISFDHNDTGEIAELHFWRGKVLSLLKHKQIQKVAAKSFVRCLIAGSPRKRFDDSALEALQKISSRLGIKNELSAWTRSLMSYNGIVFEDITDSTSIAGQRFTRIALGDYDNDGFTDLLFNGNRLYRNEDGKSFADVSDTTNVSGLVSNGGLWADFNQDGMLDFMTISHSADFMGERLMKNMDGSRFVDVSERAGDIDDRFPTEGAAWIDLDGMGYPSIYSANYETWQKSSGYPDFLWFNDKGYFSDHSAKRGMRLPVYTEKPGLAGRGVAPADFDNDGKQEILVTNYRLNRNMCWKQADSLFVDIAPLYGLAGTNKNGYYGHSIGADWGDYDNDGDLDLFIANLAHPRFIDISDISMLLRNDGLTYHVVETDTIYYWMFTDVTREAGITYDELHSDPLWFDADNDGWLDLFITSVYENDRSYLYRNNGDGTFTDITWLANARVYNGWGNASADLNRDGLPDLVVGSGNGTRILMNQTQTLNRSLYVKPVWKSGEILLPDDPEQFHKFPNSPAFGTRVMLTLRDPSGYSYTLSRELSSAKGTTSQNAQELHFGIGRSTVIDIKRVCHDQDQN